MGKKLALTAAALVALLVLLALALGLKGWDATDFAGEALERVEKEAGWKLEARSARLVPFKGLTLEGVSGTVRLGAGRGEVVADQIVLEHRPGALLSGKLALQRLVLVRPRLTLSEPAPPPPRPKPAVPPPSPKPAAASTAPPAPPPEPEEPPYEGPVSFELAQVVVEDGELLVARDGSGAGVHVEGLDLVLEAPAVAPEQRRSLARALSAGGTFRAASVELPVGRLDGIRGDVGLDEGRLVVPELRFSNSHGDFLADVQVQLASSPLRYTVSLAGEPLDLHALFDSPERELFGPARLDVSVSGAGAARDTLNGSGRLSVARGRLPSFPILNHLEAGLRRVSLHHAEHGPIAASFRIADGALELEPFTVDAAELRVAGRGRVGLDGELDLALELSSAPGDVSLRGVPDDLVELMTMPGGRLSIPVLVSGTTERPRARADAAALAERSRERGRAVDEEALRLRLDELFGLEG